MEDMSFILVLEIVLAVILARGIFVYLIVIRRADLKLQEWNAAAVEGEHLHQRLTAAVIEYRQHKSFAEDGISIIQRSQQVAMNAITTGAELARQVPSVLSAEHIQKHLYEKYDPACMKAAFLSISSYGTNPRHARNALMTVLYGEEPGAQLGDGDFFVRVYDPKGELKLCYVQSSAVLEKYNHWQNEWLSLMRVHESIVLMQDAESVK
jgi:hypothetical protein